MEQALKEQARQRIASHYETEGAILRGNKHYNDVISKYSGWDHQLAAELSLPDHIRGYGAAWDYELAANFALPDSIRAIGNAWDNTLHINLNGVSAIQNYALYGSQGYGFEASLGDSIAWQTTDLERELANSISWQSTPDPKVNTTVSTAVDAVGGTMDTALVLAERGSRYKAAMMVGQSLDQPVNQLRVNYLANASIPLRQTANTYAPITSAKSLQVLAQLNSNPLYNGAKAVAKPLPGIYAAARLGEEVYFSVENDLPLETASLNVGTRALGTAAELGGAVAAFKGGAAAGAAAGAAVGALGAGVGAVPGAAIGGFVGGVTGVVTYSFGGVGSWVNDTVTEQSRAVVGWFQDW